MELVWKMNIKERRSVLPILVVFFIFCIVYLGFNNLILYAQVFPSNCIEYNHETTTIKVMCGSFNLSQLDKALVNSDLLSSNKKEWLLSANLEIGNDATVFINSTDTSWLKIKANSDEYYGIRSHGNLIIDGIKISSWNPEANDYLQQVEDGSIKRPFLAMIENSPGQMNITNSEISYLGWYESHEQGIGYYSGDSSKMDNNEIHNLYYGFYSNGVSNLTITNNHFHHTFKYGLDPHTGSHNLLIKNNRVHDTHGLGIVCSHDCYDVIIEDNTIYNNLKAGIMFSRNMTNSIARNNTIYNESTAISVSDSSTNKIYGNKISDSKIGVALKVLRPLEYSTTENEIYENTISNSEMGILIDFESDRNIIHSNKILNSSRSGILISDFTTKANSIYGNLFLNNNEEISTKNLKPVIPVGLKNLAPSWCNNDIASSGFVEGLQYLVDRNIILGSENQSPETANPIIPEWVKNNACWWSKRLISDRDFISGLQYLFNKGIIVIPESFDEG